MPKAIVTTELADVLKTLRIQNNIQSKEVAEHINKSPAYITKLEKADLKTIDSNELSSILHFITAAKNDSNTVEEIYQSLKVKYSDEEIESQIWFTNFDTILRKIPVPSELIDIINNTLDNNNISRSYLLSRINANECLSKAENDDHSIEYNHWFRSDENDNQLKYRIKMYMSEEQLNRILDKELDISPYMFIFCILFYTNKIIKFHDTVELNDEVYTELYNNTILELNKYKFFSISAKRKLWEQEQFKNDTKWNKLFNSFDEENIKYIKDILVEFSIASQYNIKYANEKLSSFSKNLEWDLGFMLKIVSMDYSQLDEISVSNKKALLDDISKIINRYKELPSSQNKIEEY